MEMKKDDELLFLKYALPCAGTLLGKRVLDRMVTQADIDSWTAEVSEGRVPPGIAKNTFRLAWVMCDAIARKLGKKEIDAEVIQEYFLFEHNEVIKENAELMPHKDTFDCRIYPGKVLDVKDGRAIVETRLGEKEYKTAFMKTDGLNKGDTVAVHFDYISARISNENAKLMND